MTVPATTGAKSHETIPGLLPMVPLEGVAALALLLGSTVSAAIRPPTRTRIEGVDGSTIGGLQWQRAWKWTRESFHSAAKRQPRDPAITACRGKRPSPLRNGATRHDRESPRTPTPAAETEALRLRSGQLRDALRWPDGGVAVLPGALGPIERLVGGVDPLLGGVDRVRRVVGVAQARGHRDRGIARVQRELLDRLADALADAQRAFGLGLGEDDGELVSTVARR